MLDAVLQAMPWLIPNHGESNSPHAIDHDHFVEEDYRLDFHEEVIKYGYKYDQYSVKTSDGYTLLL